jgi:hypothetical protein
LLNIELLRGLWLAEEICTISCSVSGYADFALAHEHESLHSIG